MRLLLCAILFATLVISSNALLQDVKDGLDDILGGDDKPNPPDRPDFGDVLNDDIKDILDGATGDPPSPGPPSPDPVPPPSDPPMTDEPPSPTTDSPPPPSTDDYDYADNSPTGGSGDGDYEDYDYEPSSNDGDNPPLVEPTPTTTTGSPGVVPINASPGMAVNGTMSPSPALGPVAPPPSSATTMVCSVAFSAIAAAVMM